MESLSRSDRDSAHRKVGLIAAFRVRGLDEDEVAEKVKYRGVAEKVKYSGVGDMRQELEGRGFPKWFVEGNAPLKPSGGAHQEGQPRPQRTERRQESWGDGDLPRGVHALTDPAARRESLARNRDSP